MKIESRARMLVVPATIPCGFLAALTGERERRADRRHVSSHHRIAGCDGVEIDTWVINAQCPTARCARGTVVMLHPLKCGKRWFLGAARRLARLGWDVVLPDSRAHAHTGGTYLTWGAKERHDVKAVMDRLVGDGVVSGRIFVVGSSMGAMIAIQYAAIEPRCAGVMALAPPASARKICRRILLLSRQADFDAALSLASKLAHFDPDDASAEAAAARLTCPLLLIHSWWDLVVPYSHGRAVYRAAPGPKKFQTLWLRNHAPEFCLSGWVVHEFHELLKMAGEA